MKWLLAAIVLLMPPTTEPFQPLSYVCHRTDHPIAITGRGDDPAWSKAPWTADFIDIEGDIKPRPRFRTRAKMLWDDHYFYVYAELEEPHVWGTLTHRNAIIYNDNDFEIFIDAPGTAINYYEFEINALGTVMELTLDKPYIHGGNYTFREMPGLRTAVHVDGTVNNPTDTDRHWSVEVAIPFAGLGQLSGHVRTCPEVKDVWRVNFSRVQWQHTIVDGKYLKVPKDKHPEDNWVWSAQGVIDMHRPEKWGFVEFAP